jgi:hypothetical protein
MPARTTRPKAICLTLKEVPSQSHSIKAPNGAMRQLFTSSDKREPSRGSAWKSAISPMPIPTTPLRRNVGNACPSSPLPNPKAQVPSNSVAATRRQKFASVPPSTRAERCAQTMERANRTVQSSAANTTEPYRDPAGEESGYSQWGNRLRARTFN